jgi:hypothetical protein
MIRSVQGLPGLCLNERNYVVLLDRIISDLPTPGKEDAAALFVQSSIAKFMACPK